MDQNAINYSQITTIHHDETHDELTVITTKGCKRLWGEVANKFQENLAAYNRTCVGKELGIYSESDMKSAQEILKANEFKPIHQFKPSKQPKNA
ncbi:hypothetical protein [Spirosoma linguale]